MLPRNAEFDTVIVRGSVRLLGLETGPGSRGHATAATPPTLIQSRFGVPSRPQARFWFATRAHLRMVAIYEELNEFPSFVQEVHSQLAPRLERKVGDSLQDKMRKRESLAELFFHECKSGAYNQRNE
jgi:hypothetical protein